MNVQQTETTKLIPYINNAKIHSDKQVGMIAASIKEFGFNNPILTDGDNGVIAGHGRLMAAQKLGLDKVPVIELGHLSDAQKKAYILADNRLGEVHVEWDMELVDNELKFLDELEFDVVLTGFEMPESLEDGLTDEDAVPDMPEEPKVKRGDVWVLGDHRVMCGDSTVIDDVDKLMSDGKADMVFTDPPYGMSYGGGRAGAVGSSDGTVKRFGVIKGDDARGDDLIDLVRDALVSCVACSKSGSAMYVCFPWRTYAEFKEAMPSDIKSCIVWNKGSIGLGSNKSYRPQHEFIFFIAGDGWYGGASQSDVWTMSRGATGKYVHPTQKPVELIEKALSNSSKGGDIILDVFGGSGSTLIACEKTNRSARLMGLDEKYCDVIINRWQDFAGKDAVLESTGETYEAISG